jgi:hypothetical protein
MASIINASSSGSGGIVQTADASGVLQLQSNGTVALSISGANVTLSGTVTTGPISLSTANGSMATFNSTNANGGYIGVQTSGVAVGYVGASAQLGGGGNNLDMALRADANLYLVSYGSAKYAKLDTNGYLLTPYQPAFYATRSASTTVASGAAVLFDSVPLNQGSGYNSATGRFTAPVAGTYHFSSVILAQSLSPGDNCEWGIVNQSGTGALMGRMTYQVNYTGSGGYMWSCGSVTYYMSAGDYFYISNNSGATRTINNTAWVNFSGFLIG